MILERMLGEISQTGLRGTPDEVHEALLKVLQDDLQGECRTESRYYPGKTLSKKNRRKTLGRSCEHFRAKSLMDCLKEFKGIPGGSQRELDIILWKNTRWNLGRSPQENPRRHLWRNHEQSSESILRKISGAIPTKLRKKKLVNL